MKCNHRHAMEAYLQLGNTGLLPLENFIYIGHSKTLNGQCKEALAALDQLDQLNGVQNSKLENCKNKEEPYLCSLVMLLDSDIKPRHKLPITAGVTSGLFNLSDTT